MGVYTQYCTDLDVTLDGGRGRGFGEDDAPGLSTEQIITRVCCILEKALATDVLFSFFLFAMTHKRETVSIAKNSTVKNTLNVPPTHESNVLVRLC